MPLTSPASSSLGMFGPPFIARNVKRKTLCGLATTSDNFQSLSLDEFF